MIRIPKKDLFISQREDFLKKCSEGIDVDAERANFSIPLFAGPDVVGCVLVNLGLQIGPQFCPVAL